MKEVRFIDLFAGLGGFRIGFEKGLNTNGILTKCVMTSEIKPHALKALQSNFNHSLMVGDITKISDEDIPDFDFLLAGFPCQPFSAGGKRLGFIDTRGTLFFEIERILRAKKPMGFILENVEGLVKHDLANKGDKIGKTLQTIVNNLEGLGYCVSWKVLNAADFGLAQSRNRIFIVGMKDQPVILDDFPIRRKKLKSILESDIPPIKNKIADLLLKKYSTHELYGKSIKDKRGGKNNIHSWDIGLKGKVSKDQVELLNKIFTERRKKHWSAEIGIDWMDGIPLTLKQIQTFYSSPKLKEMLDDLVNKGYLDFEHPKALYHEETSMGIKSVRKPNASLPKGYNIVSGKLSFEINKVLDPNGLAPTLVATDMSRLAILSHNGFRRITLREGLRLFGFPEKYKMPLKDNEGFDLLGNTIAVNVVSSVSERIGKQLIDRGLLVK